LPFAKSADKHNRTAHADQASSGAARLPVIAGLVLIALACTCGPLQQVQNAQATIGAVQATVGPALTAYKENEPTIQAALTELAKNAPTYEAYMTEFSGSATAGGPEFNATMNAAVPGFDATMTAILSGGGSGGAANDNLVHQWASSASASSQLGDSDWSASQAAGGPDVPQCGHDSRAWANADPAERATLTLVYDQPVFPVRIAISHAYYPTSVVQVEVVDINGQHTVVVNKTPALINVCPFTEVFTVANVLSSPVNTVIITVDQAQIRSWDEIDAVELAGVP
jgi:hypothetical protein